MRVFGTACTSGDMCCSRPAIRRARARRTRPCAAWPAHRARRTPTAARSAASAACAPTSSAPPTARRAARTASAAAARAPAASAPRSTRAARPTVTRARRTPTAARRRATRAACAASPRTACRTATRARTMPSAAAISATSCRAIRFGLCTHPMPGSTNCSAGVDGTVCSGCGDCCSRLCEVYAPTGVKVSARPKAAASTATSAMSITTAAARPVPPAAMAT